LVKFHKSVKRTQEKGERPACPVRATKSSFAEMHTEHFNKNIPESMIQTFRTTQEKKTALSDHNRNFMASEQDIVYNEY
ncbi:unnamed protein product, partial [Bubo scandiacus]